MTFWPDQDTELCDPKSVSSTWTLCLSTARYGPAFHKDSGKNEKRNLSKELRKVFMGVGWVCSDATTVISDPGNQGAFQLTRGGGVTLASGRVLVAL